MAVLGRANFEIQLYKGGRWAIFEVVPTEETARHKAADLLAMKTTEGVRIIKESLFGGDSRRESEIFCQMKAAERGDDFTVTPVDESPLCEQVADYYQTAARTTMARLFTKYLEKQEMTPFELLHSHKNLKRMLNIDSMVPSAVDKIASLHARVSNGDARKRRDVIYAAVDAIAKRARGRQQGTARAQRLNPRRTAAAHRCALHRRRRAQLSDQCRFCAPEHQLDGLARQDVRAPAHGQVAEG